MSKQQVQLNKSTFKGTKGNWSYRIGGKNKHGVTEIEIDSDYGVSCLATVYAPDCFKEDKEIYTSNARIIAAAPDLLAFAIDFIEKVESGRAKSTDSYNKAKIAVAKALNFTNG